MQENKMSFRDIRRRYRQQGYDLGSQDIQWLMRYITKLQKQKKNLKQSISFCLSQDWSFGNHGPPDVCEILHRTLKENK